MTGSPILRALEKVDGQIRRRFWIDVISSFLYGVSERHLLEPNVVYSALQRGEHDEDLLAIMSNGIDNVLEWHLVDRGEIGRLGDEYNRLFDRAEGRFKQSELNEILHNSNGRRPVAKHLKENDLYRCSAEALAYHCDELMRDQRELLVRYVHSDLQAQYNDWSTRREAPSRSEQVALLHDTFVAAVQAGNVPEISHEKAVHNGKSHAVRIEHTDLTELLND